MANQVYQIITDRIIEKLKNGVVPWHKPWTAGAHGWPKNLLSKHEYRGVNVFLLSATDYALPYWLTFRQAKQTGGHVRKGEKSTPVVFWKLYRKENTQTGEADEIPVLRYYNVFNVAQCEGLEGKLPDVEQPDAQPFEPIDECERIVAGMPQPPAIHHGTIGAFYRPSDDSVHLPDRERFESPAGYYVTLLHELTHSTGHESRLNRKGITEPIHFGSRTYSQEELVAEMGAAFLCGHAGIENRVLDNSAAYVSGWLKRLKSDNRLVVYAAAAAQKAADFILGERNDG